MWWRICWLAILGLAACGDDLSLSPVSLTITFRGQPAPGRLVYFQEADGTLSSIEATDDSGIARARLRPGGYVTTLDAFGRITMPDFPEQFDDLRTFGGVQPGDELKLHIDATTAFTANVNVPTSPNAVTYNVQTSCTGHSEIPATDTLAGVALLTCGDVVDIGVAAMRANDYAFLLATDLPIPPDNGTIDLSSRAYSAGTSNVTATWTHIPSYIVGYNIHTTVATSRGTVFAADGNRQVAGPTESVTQLVPNVPGTTWSVFTTTGAASLLDQFVFNWGAAGSDINVDFDDVVGPLSGFRISQPSHSVTWTAGAGAPPDLIDVAVIAKRGPISWRWELAAPVTGTSVTFPELAGDLAQYNWGPREPREVSQTTVAKVPGGYDAVRADIMATHGRATVPVGPSGQLSYAF